MSEDKGELKEAKTKHARRRGAPLLFGGLVLLLLAGLVALQLFGLWEGFTPDTARDTLLIYALSTLNFRSCLLFTFIFIISLLQLRPGPRGLHLVSNRQARVV